MNYFLIFYSRFRAAENQNILSQYMYNDIYIYVNIRIYIHTNNTLIIRISFITSNSYGQIE